jgi:endonuclease III
MQDRQIHNAMRILRKVARDLPVPYVTRLAGETHDPFLILIATVLSLRTRDLPTQTASEHLFALARSPADMVELPWKQIAGAIAPAMYSSVKAQNIHRICEILLAEYDGHVPADLELLDALPGVGRKTANLVITLGFNQPGICVDTHVHRITNRWGYVATKTPDETELALRAKLPRKYWIEINSELVAFGQNICVAASPKCSICPLSAYCERVGVKNSR